MNSDNLILRQTDYPPLVNKDDFLDNADFDSNMINIYDDLLALCLTNGVIAYDISTEYDDAVINYATYSGKLWKFVNAVPASNVTPGTNELYWLEVFPTEMAHRKNSDTILDEGGTNEVTASEIRAFIDAGLTSTTNLSLSEQTDVSLKINSSTGSDVTLLGATETTAGLLISDDKQKLNQLSGINSGDQTLESLGAEATANKVIDFSVIDNVTFPTTEAVANKITSDVVALVDAELTNYEPTANKSTDVADFASSIKFPVWSAIVSYFSAVKIRSILGITTLSGSNTGDQDLSAYQLILTSIVEYTASQILGLSDSGKLVIMNVGSANNLDVPPNVDVAFPVGTQISVVQNGAGKTRIRPGVGVTLNSDTSKTYIASQFSGCTLIKTAL